ncbi:MAG: hypothetical protein KKB30_15070 [Proteobacteria bacterium]|nr:hypothetical protein [Pseudomonadota bacterium]MBU1714383.1 hypothetical protein [Pseudomonadota bacterium]
MSENWQDIIHNNKLQQVGIVGVPPLPTIQALHDNNIIIHDLDAILVKADLENSVPYLPRVYCAILRTVVINAMNLKLDAIFIDTGPGKCDAAFHVSTILKENLKIPIIRTSNNDHQGFGYPLCLTRMNPTEKLVAITEGVKSPVPLTNPPDPCHPTAGFWGVPPRDFSIMKLFPDTTHVYGWTRCMENKTPADADLEALYNPEVPTIFFAQSFCAKTALARMLANKHPRALYLDIDVHTGSSARAKIQAFFELSGVKI